MPGIQRLSLNIALPELQTGLPLLTAQWDELCIKYFRKVQIDTQQRLQLGIQPIRNETRRHSIRQTFAYVKTSRHTLRQYSIFYEVYELTFRVNLFKPDCLIYFI